MKKSILFLFLGMFTTLLNAQQQSNDFYDDADPYYLSGPRFIEVSGENENPGTIDLADFPLHSVIVKEAELAESSNKFIGAYRYDGVSL
ncbi:MAG: hypothetical protein U5Q03_19625 [Bacteroidota bacterium]|nr:hypothetical protein [Bacteroidota bacterium]